ncbi:MAG: ketoacyl-ACP synthase III [Oscillospiraceae bacterium]|nr:ketoacyl-ACP synthase III [Oscillospiraceae bacterium]
MSGINIVSTGGYAPLLAVTNDDMSRLVETNDEWIRTRTGISERRMSNCEPTWYMGAMASKQAIERAGIDPKEIGLIISSTITNDFVTPSASCLIQRETGAVNAAAFDLGAACSGFVYAVDTACRFLATDESLKYVLISANENLSYITNFTDRSSCVLFGDGAAAVILERSDKLYTSWLGADGTGAKYLYAKNEYAHSPFTTEEHFTIDDQTDPEVKHRFLVQDGKEVYKFATKALPTAAKNAAEKIGLDINDIDLFIPHQANIRIIETAAKNLGVSMDKFYTNIDMHGNTSSASIPIALNEAAEKGVLKRGMKVCLVGFGAGLTLGAAIIEY